MCGKDLWIFLQILGVLYLARAQSGDLCQTPRNARGECIVVNQCAPLFSILEKRPIRPQDADYLRRSQCGFEGTLPKVCCPLDAPISTSRPTSRPEISSPNENLLPKNCGLGIPDRIIGGEKADISEFPWMALIEYERDNGRRGFYCGGVLISQKYVLTAAHCVKGKDLPTSWSLVSVRLGEYNTETSTDCVDRGFGKQECSPPPQNIPVQERIAHEDYDPFDMNQYHDIALLRLAREVQLSGYVLPICLPRSAVEQSKTLTPKLTVAGWGKTENRSESEVKLKLVVPLKSNSECSRTYRAANVNLNDGQVCAGGEKGKDSCRGDSGGPLMSLQSDENGEISWYSVGVVSFGPTPCGLENWPGVYTKVASYVPWIISKLRP